MWQPPSHPASHVAVAITLYAKASSLKTRPLGIQLAGWNSNLFIIHHFFHPFCSTGCRCRQSSWMKHRSGHYSYRCPCELFALCKNKVRQKLDTRQVLSDPVSCRPVICCFWPHLLRPRPRPLKSGVWSQDQDHTWLGWYIRWRRLTNSGQNAVGYRCATRLYTVYVYDLWLVDVSYCFMVSTYVCARKIDGCKFVCRAAECRLSHVCKRGTHFLDFLWGSTSLQLLCGWVALCGRELLLTTYGKLRRASVVVGGGSQSLQREDVTIAGPPARLLHHQIFVIRPPSRDAYYRNFFAPQLKIYVSSLAALFYSTYPQLCRLAQSSWCLPTSQIAHCWNVRR